MNANVTHFAECYIGVFAIPFTGFYAAAILVFRPAASEAFRRLQLRTQ
jgi:hypothetical protein